MSDHVPGQAPPDDAVLATLRKHFSEARGTWHLHANGPHRHYGEEILFPASVYVDLSKTGWRVSTGDDGVASAARGEGTSGLEGVEPGSLEELNHLLLAFMFNVGQAIEEMGRAFREAAGARHVYVEPGAVSKVFHFCIAPKRYVRAAGMGYDLDDIEDDDMPESWAVVVSPYEYAPGWCDCWDDMPTMGGDYYSILDGAFEMYIKPGAARRSLLARGFIEDPRLMDRFPEHVYREDHNPKS